MRGWLQGFHSGGMPVALLGVGKGLVGLAVRPTMGLLEMTSKGTYGMGLVCLGREAISGSTLRRVRAPGALAEDSSEVPSRACLPVRTVSMCCRALYGGS